MSTRSDRAIRAGKVGSEDGGKTCSRRTIRVEPEADLGEKRHRDLFPYLSSFRASADSPATLEYKIGEIFHEVRNKIQSGYNLRDVLDLADALRFMSTEEKHELSHLYEGKIQRIRRIR